MARPETDPAVSARLRAAFQADELTLRAALDKARADFDHRGIKGDAVEGAVRSFLRSHLPRKFDVGKGEVIDRFGNRSNQADVIILNDEQPFVHGPETDGIYLAEGVSALGEVKSVLGSGDLKDVLDKGARIRTLKPQPLTGDMVVTNPSDRPRFIGSFAYFALAMESKLTAETILQKLKAEPPVPSASDPGVMLEKLDALFVLGTGVFYNFGLGNGSFQFIHPDGTAHSGWAIEKSGGALVELFAWLNGVMPRITRGHSIATPYLMASTAALGALDTK